MFLVDVQDWNIHHLSCHKVNQKALMSISVITCAAKGPWELVAVGCFRLVLANIRGRENGMMTVTSRPFKTVHDHYSGDEMGWFNTSETILDHLVAQLPALLVFTRQGNPNYCLKLLCSPLSCCSLPGCLCLLRKRQNNGDIWNCS